MSVYPNKCVIEGYEIGDLCGDVTDCVKHGCYRARYPAAPPAPDAVKYCPVCGGAGEYTDGPTEEPQRRQCEACYGTGLIDAPPAAPPDDLVARLKKWPGPTPDTAVKQEAAARIAELQAENAKLRAVVEAAKVLRLHPRHKPGCASCAEADASFDAAIDALEQP